MADRINEGDIDGVTLGAPDSVIEGEGVGPGVIKSTPSLKMISLIPSARRPMVSCKSVRKYARPKREFMNLRKLAGYSLAVTFVAEEAKIIVNSTSRDFVVMFLGNNALSDPSSPVVAPSLLVIPAAGLILFRDVRVKRDCFSTVHVVVTNPGSPSPPSGPA